MNTVGVVARRAHAAVELLSHAVGDRVRAAVGLEAREVEAERLGARPQVRVLEPPWSSNSASCIAQKAP